MSLSDQLQTELTAWLGAPVEITNCELLRDWSASQVWRVTARAGDARPVFYAKLAREGLAAELAIYQLASTLPSFPAPHGICRTIAGERWLILRQVEGEQLYLTKDPRQYLAAAAGLAAWHERGSQLRWDQQLPDLPRILLQVDQLATGICDRLRALAISGDFANMELDLLEEARLCLLRQWPILRRLLARYPATLLHGDSHSGNIFITAGEIQMIDWAGAAIGPGLLDLIALIDTGCRMQEPLGEVTDLLAVYWSNLSAESRGGYGSRDQASAVLRVCRSLLELDWFSRSGDDYGERANRELHIILAGLSELGQPE